MLNDKGLHMRPSTELVKCVNAYNSQVKLIFGDFIVNAKSLIGILTLGATSGSHIEIEATGEDAEEVIKSIQKLAEKQFYIHY